MPYRRAHWVVAALTAATFLAFWPNYLPKIGSAPRGRARR